MQPRVAVAVSTEARRAEAAGAAGGATLLRSGLHSRLPNPAGVGAAGGRWPGEVEGQAGR